MRILLIVLLFLNSCGKATPFPAYVVFDESVSADLIESFYDSVEDLNDFLGQKFSSFDPPKNRSDAYPIIISYSETESPDGYAGLALISSNMCAITIYPVTLRKGLLKTVMWHELAHCADVLHTDTTDDIMSPAVRDIGWYTEEAMLRFKNQVLEALHNR